MRSEKSVFRVRKTSNFVSISRFTLEDERLSWEARGLHAFLLAKPDDWKTNIAHLIKCSPAGRDKTRRIIKELIEYNYIIKSEQRSLQGQFAAPQYIVYEVPYDGYLEHSFNSHKKPETEYPSTVKPSPENPSSSNPPLLSKQTETNKQLNNKTTTKVAYIWPDKITESEKDSISNLISGVEKKSGQTLLDEMAGQIDKINNPVGYFRTLLQAYFSDEFIPAKALQVKEARKVSLANQKAIEQSQQDAEKQFQEKLNQFLGETNEKS